MLFEILYDENLWMILLAFFVLAPVFGVASLITASASFIAFVQWLENFLARVNNS
jgi:hypothetical protein